MDELDAEFQPIAGKERTDRICRLVFNRENIKQIKGAVNKVLDIFYDILEKEFKYGSYYTMADIDERLKNTSEKEWKAIREKYLQDEFHGYCNGNFSDDERKHPSILMLDMLKAMDNLRESVHTKIDQKHIAMMEMEEKLNEFRDRSDAVYTLMMEEKHKTSGRLTDASKKEGRLKFLEETLVEKNKRIQELERASAVQLWEKEKEKVLQSANEKIKELENEIERLHQTKNSLNRKMSTIDDQRKMMMLKNEKNGIQSGGDDSLKRELYLKEKDITHLENEIYNQQKLFLGVLGGIRTDVLSLSEKLFNHETQQRDPDLIRVTNFMDKIYSSTVNGTLKSTRSLLPPHYTFIEADVKLCRTRRLSKATVLPMVITKTQSESNLLKDKEVNLPPQSVNNIQAKPLLPAITENPLIVDPKTDKLNGSVYLKHFAHMSQSFILDHWSKFKEFDQDNSRTLDLEELMKILTAFGCEVTPDVVGEAMSEVDTDNSETLDFFEYLHVVDKVVRKSGKSKLFQKGLSKQNSQVSKACVIQ